MSELVVAGCPVWKEYPPTLFRAGQSCAEAGIPFFVFAGGCGPGRRFKTQAGMRQHGLEIAKRHYKADWYLQLDADERLRNGADLPLRLERAGSAYPLPLLQEDGSLLLAPFKLIRTSLEFVAQADYFRSSTDTVWLLSGYVAPAELREALLAGPYLEHCPSDRPPSRRTERLSDEEPWLEPRPTEAVQWPLPELTFNQYERSSSMSEVPQEATHYCPGCGLKYSTPGVCTGPLDSPHPPLQVEEVASVPATEEDASAIASAQAHEDAKAENESLRAQVASLEEQLANATATGATPFVPPPIETAPGPAATPAPAGTQQAATPVEEPPTEPAAP